MVAAVSLILSIFSALGIGWIAFVWRPKELGSPLQWRILTGSAGTYLAWVSLHYVYPAFVSDHVPTHSETICWLLASAGASLTFVLLFVLERRSTRLARREG